MAQGTASEPARRALRLVAALTALQVGACAVGPGPAEQQAAYAAQACQMGDRQACYDYQALYPAVAAERQQQEAQNAAVGTAAAIGIVGLAAGAALASSGGRHHYDRRDYRSDRRYERSRYERRYDDDRYYRR